MPFPICWIKGLLARGAEIGKWRSGDKRCWGKGRRLISPIAAWRAREPANEADCCAVDGPSNRRSALRIVLAAIEDDLADAWERHCGDLPDVTVHRGPILDLAVDAVVSPA